MQAELAFTGRPALVLNADHQPLSYFPLSLWSWQDTIKAVFLQRVRVLEEYDQEIRSPTFKMNLPSVVCLREYVQQKSHPAFTRFNVFLRDGFACQYCSAEDKDLTFDHLIPRVAGGRTTWDNIVTACSPCNLKKGRRSLKEARMSPKKWPKQPTVYELRGQGRRFPPHYLHESWADYLYWDAELEA